MESLRKNDGKGVVTIGEDHTIPLPAKSEFMPNDTLIIEWNRDVCVITKKTI